MRLFLLFVEKTIDNCNTALGSEILLISKPVLSLNKNEKAENANPERKKQLVKIVVKKPFPVPEKEVIVPGIKYLVELTTSKTGKKIITYKFNPAVFLSEFMIFFKRYEDLYFEAKSAVRYTKDNLTEEQISKVKKTLEIMKIFDQFVFFAFHNAGYFEVYRIKELEDTVNSIKKAHSEILENTEVIEKIINREVNYGN